MDDTLKATLIAKKNRIAALITAANVLDEAGDSAAADKITRLAEVEAADADIAAEEGGVETESAILKQLVSFETKLDRFLSKSKLALKIDEACKAKGCKVDIRQLIRTLEDAHDALKSFKA